MATNRTFMKDIYHKMLRIRMIEEAIAAKYSEQEMRCPVHLSIGQEGTAVAICEHLAPGDLMVSTHRGHAHYLAKGGNLNALIAELYGKVGGCSRGQGGSMHLVDWSAGFAGSTSIVGGTIPIGVGLAFAKKIKREPGVVVICIGDAAIEQGVFHESANFASLHNLPILFVLENNLYSCYTHLSERQPNRPLMDVAKAHGMKSRLFDGNNGMQTAIRMLKPLNEIRLGNGPLFAVFETYRFLEHCGPSDDSHLGYKKKQEREFWKKRDPLTVGKKELEKIGQWSWGFEERCVKAIKEEIETAFAAASLSPFPEEEYFEYASN